MYTNENQFKIYSKKWLDRGGIPASSHCLEGNKITLPLEIYVTLNVSMCACRSSCINQHTWHKKVLSQEEKNLQKPYLRNISMDQFIGVTRKGILRVGKTLLHLLLLQRTYFFSSFHNRQVTTTVTPAPGESSTLLWLLLETILTCTHRQTRTVNTYKK